MGEGGGQVLRTSLSLSLITQQPFAIHQIRAKRKPPGLRPQHLGSVIAAKDICSGRVIGEELGSKSIKFFPGSIKSGNYTFDIGTAGSTSLLLQTIYLPLSFANHYSKVTIYGGTHVPWSPCFHYIAWNWLPYLSSIGIDLSVSMERAGYYPEGGGKIIAQMSPLKKLSPINLLQRGKVKEIRGISAVSNLPRKIAERQRDQVVRRLGTRYPLNDIRIKDLPSNNKGTILFLMIECEHTRACFFGLGELGKPAEGVADDAIEATLNFLNCDGAIDPFLADQLLLPSAIIKSTSIFTTSKVTNHLLTNAKIIMQFLPVEIRIEGNLGCPGKIKILPL